MQRFIFSIILEKLRVAQLVKFFFFFYGIRKDHLRVHKGPRSDSIQSQMNLIQIFMHHNPLRSILNGIFHLFLSHPIGHLPSYFSYRFV
jgi:hypothetical protein